MNINHLRYFKEVCRQGSITKASEVCHISQPSITAAINGMENEFGYKIFNRINNHLHLTEEGRQLLAITDSLLSQFDDFYEKASEISRERKSVIRLGVPSVLGTFLFKKIIPDFETHFPDIRLEIYEIATMDGIRMLENAELDLLIGIKNERSYADCDSMEIFSTELRLAVSRNSFLADKEAISGNMLKGLPMVIISKGSYHYDEIMKNFGDEELNIIMHSSQIATIKYMVAGNNAVTIIYKDVFEDDPEIRCIPFEVPMPAYVNVFWQRNTYKTEAMRKFILYLTKIDF